MRLYGIQTNTFGGQQFGLWRDPDEPRAFVKEAIENFQSLPISKFLIWFAPYLEIFEGQKIPPMFDVDVGNDAHYREIWNQDSQREYVQKVLEGFQRFRIFSFEVHGTMFEQKQLHKRLTKLSGLK